MTMMMMIIASVYQEPLPPSLSLSLSLSLSPLLFSSSSSPSSFRNSSVTVYVRDYYFKSDGKTPDRKNYPWIGKSSITELGNPEEFLKVFAPQLSVSEKFVSSEEIDGVTYYRYLLYKQAANYNNRKVISAAVYNGDLVTCVGLASEANWEKAKPVLLEVVNSFRVG